MNDGSKAPRTLAALVIAAPLTALILEIIYALWGSAIGSAPDDPENVVATWLISSVFILMISMTLGLLLHGIAIRFRRTELLSYLVGSAIIGIIVAAALSQRILESFFTMGPWGDPEAMMRIRLGVIAFGGVPGIITALVFWLIRRPDRDQSSPASANETSA
jgi:hypothetical protein